MLDELAASLQLLRDESDAATVWPTPGLEQVAGPGRVDAGHRCRSGWAIGGPHRRVPKPVGTAAYRIVQESLTNVLRHAGRRRPR